MARRPITIDWKNLFPGSGAGELPPPEEAPSTSVPSDLSDYELNEKIVRMSKLLNNGTANRLPDKGFRVRSELRDLNNEQDRRNLARIQKGVDKCQMASKTEIGKLPDKSSESGSNVTRAEPDSREACFSSRRLPSVRCTEGDKQTLSNNKYSDASPSNNYSGHAGNALPRRVSKRRRTSNWRSMSGDFEEVQHVVLLDDEDVQPTLSVRGHDTSEDRNEHKIYYPSRDEPECVELSRSDLECLGPESYLSSPIMNFYIQFLQRSESFKVVRKGDCYIFNTFFYSKLEEAMHCKDNRSEYFKKLRRWWKGVDLFRKAYILLPIHGGMHWSLVIICIPAKEDESSLFILHLDSLGVHASNLIFQVVGSFLKEEWNYINQSAPPKDFPLSDKLWRFLPRRIEKEKVMVPQQKNDYDCGLFVLYFMERFIKEAPQRLRRKNLSMFGKKWFDPAEASRLRKTIHELIVKEFEKTTSEESEDVAEETESSSAASEST